MNIINFKDFSKIEICVGTILSAEENNLLNKPSITLKIDFGEKLGIKKSSAQLKKNYDTQELLNKQILAVVNFEPKQIGKITSEVLVLGLPDENNQPILISPDSYVENGRKVY